MGSIRAVTNSANEVISAYDYDAWGYKLREWKSGDDAKYRFTGKERDNETSYDYFGARYYDSRIGRWGQREPLYEKYINITPYCYSLNNPMVLKDLNGKDAEVTLKGKVAFIKVEIFFISDEGYGKFNKNAISKENAELYAQYVSDAEDQWNDATLSFMRGGNLYTPVFQFEFKEVTNAQEYNDYVNATGEKGIDDGKNYFVETSSRKENPSVKRNILTFLRTSNYHGRNLKPFWAAHELGHLLGLEHPSNIKSGDVMAYGSYNTQVLPPQGSNIIQIMKQLDKINPNWDFDRANINGGVRNH
ncbi:MAG: hypothetical protein K1X86_11905 [Ignavibacteria bacterium]|nr:hypothetical protein [Ignavibacteria bacterium]